MRSPFVLLTCVLMALAASWAPTSAAQSNRAVDTILTVPSTPLEAPSVQRGLPKFFQRDGDHFKSPQAIEAFERRQTALQQRLAGKGKGKIQEIAKGQYVELALERTDKIFAVIVEFGDHVSTDPNVSTAAGPLHNAIPEPNRTLDNSTIWQPDYNSAHYTELYNVNMADYYQKQSSGRYTVNGTVTEWVKVPFNEARYGSPLAGDAAVWTLIADAINIWTNDQIAHGKTLEEIKAYLKTFDTWDRYDYDGDGNFDEPDGYIDHFQIVHAGVGEEAGGGALGADAIWSHSWFAFFNYRGYVGPSYNPYGGIEFGGGWGANPNGTLDGSQYAWVGSNYATVTNAHPDNHTGIWVGDYTIQPENGGLGVFAHEYAHDLGIPDHYDTAGGANAVGFWNIMAQGSWLGDGTEDIGSKPGDMSAWDKFLLGWLNYEVAPAGVFSTHRMGPAETNSKAAQGLFVILPKSTNTRLVIDPRYPPFGTYAWWGGDGNLRDNTLTRTIQVPTGTPELRMRVQFAIEFAWDYAYVEVSTNNGVSWQSLPGKYQSGDQWFDLTTNDNPNGPNLGNGITGTTRGWLTAKFGLSTYAGQTVLLRLRYKTDEYTYLKGILFDDIVLGDFSDGAEAGDNGWTASGFLRTTGTLPTNKSHYYLAEYRQYRDYDSTLQTGPYIFGYALQPNMVAHYPYQDGLLVTYWDTDQPDDNSSQHYGEGRTLPVDAHPDPLLRYVQLPGYPPFYSAWNAYVQSYDSTFGLQPTDSIALPYYGGDGSTWYQFQDYQPSLPAVPVFNDLNSYWSATTPSASVIVPKTGTIIRVVNTNTQDNFMQVNVEPVK